MSKSKDLKRRVRERMAKTGESYTAARANLIARNAPPLPADYAELAGKSDDVLAAKTGRAWPEWVRELDAVGAASMPHGEIAARVAERIDSGWWAQTVAVGYERIRGLREVGQRRDGTYEIGKSRTFRVPTSQLYRAFVDPDVRRRWLDVDLVIRKASERYIHITWPDGTWVSGGFDAKADDRSVIAVQHSRLPSREAGEDLKRFWTERLDDLGRVLDAMNPSRESTS
jgi:hypothetical protein